MNHDSGMMHFRQRNVRTKVEFRFHGDYLEYAFIDGDGDKTGFNLKYEHIPGEFDYRTYRSPDMFITFPVLMVAGLGLLHLFTKEQDHIKIIGFLIVYAAVLAGVGYLCRLVLKKDYVALPVAEGTILIVKDKNHKKILAELQSRRMAALKKYAVIDPLAPSGREVAKFEWLRDQHVISEEEFVVYKECILLSMEHVIGKDKTKKEQILN